MTQPLWLFSTRLTIIADATTTGGQYDLIEGYMKVFLLRSVTNFWGLLERCLNNAMRI